MDEFETTTPDSLPDDTHVMSADDNGTVSNTSEKQESLTLDELNTLLGKNFKSKETALKSVKDTYNYVGKRKEDIVREVTTDTSGIANEVKELKANMFFKDNPDFAPYRSIMEKLGSNPAEVANMPEFKGIVEKAVGYDKSQSLKSVLVTNPRLAMSKDNLTKAREATSTEERERLATRAVLDSLEA